MRKPLVQRLDAQKIGERIKIARRSMVPPMSQPALARAIGAKGPSLIGHWERGRNPPSLENAVAVARVLMVRADWLLHGQEPMRLERPLMGPATEMETNGVKLTQTEMPAFGSWPMDIPVRATGDANIEGGFEIIEGDVIDHVRRPPLLMHVASAYAIYCHVSLMSPVFEPGDPIWIHPKRHANIGDYALVTVVAEGSVEIACLVRVLAKTPDALTVEQFKPNREFNIPSATIKSVHYVVRPNDLLRG